MFVADVALLTLLAGTVIPLIVGIVTTKLQSRRQKAAIMVLLSGASGAVNGAISAGGVFTKESLVAAGAIILVSLGTHYGVYKPTGVTNHLQENIGRTDN